MPPFISKKRRRSPSPVTDPVSTSTPKKPTRTKATTPKTAQPPPLVTIKDFISDSSSSTLSDVDSSDFEEVLPPKSQTADSGTGGDDDQENDEVDWEDAVPEPTPSGPEPSGELNLTLDKTKRYALSNPLNDKRGPSKRERRIRNYTHCMHVQFLMFHNLIRNSWLCDQDLQEILVKSLPPGVKKEFEKWQVASGIISTKSPKQEKQRAVATKNGKQIRKQGPSSKNPPKQRDWGNHAERLEEGVPNLSRGDPLERFLNLLGPWWKKRFTVTAPGLRKQGYKTLETLEDQRLNFEKDPTDAEEYGERIVDIKALRKRAKVCHGSRDVGAQLYVALLRGLGFDARLVCNLQPLGFGWSKVEEAETSTANRHTDQRKQDERIDPGQSSDVDMEDAAPPPTQKPNAENKTQATKAKVNTRPKRKSRGDGAKETPLELDSGSDSHISDVEENSNPIKPSKLFDRDLAFPHYWIEVLSPITNKYFSVDPIVTSTIAGSADKLMPFEPRGAKADKAKQIMAYVVAFSSDGCAKDVTIRYLRKRLLPGRTKGFRYPTEKVPVYNRRGKVSRNEEYDWFKRLMGSYNRPQEKRTAADDIEDSTDLVPAQPATTKKSNEETLQGFKTSDIYVLERHLKREEALCAGAQHVKTFLAGKGDKAQPEKVFLRKDVLACKTSESWHKEGREVDPGEQPLKLVPMRAVTLNRKREIEQYEAEGGKMMQGLYSRAQTDWIIPPPIVDGKIPRNAYGNMDCFVPSMVPQGAVHLPYRGLGRICKKLEIDYAEAVTGFEFGNQRAVPVIQGVIVAEENEDVLIEAWEAAEEAREQRERIKRAKQCLTLWKKFLVGLRIVERVRAEYGGGDGKDEEKDEINPFTNQKIASRTTKQSAPIYHRTSGTKGTSMEANDAEDDLMCKKARSEGGFLRDDDDNEIRGGEFVVDHDPDEMMTKRRPAKFSNFSSSEEDLPAKPNASVKGVQAQKGKAAPQTRRRNAKMVPSSSEEDNEDEDEEKADCASDSDGPSSSDIGLKPPINHPRHRPPLADRKAGGKKVQKMTDQAIKADRPTRKAAKRSQGAVRSHYFENTGEEDEDEDSED
ncbi:MAG: hypothetical protein M1814_004618 [Vezdaea aestivalis]|nr:MAG: hypothetical protein M1814_004618 [Vezdaea aestivalis]